MDEQQQKLGHSLYRKMRSPSFRHTPFLEITDAQITSFNTKDKVAFTAIYNQLFPSIFYFACRFVSVQDAEDVTADIFCKLWKTDKHFANIKNIKVFLQVSVRNACLSRFEHQEVVKKANRSLAISMEYETGEPGFIHDEISLEQISRILAEIEKLTSRQKKVMILSCVGGLKEKEIAAKLGISIATVHTHKIRAVKNLRMAFFLSLGCLFILHFPA